MAPLLKCFQAEIDNLNKRSNAAEVTFLSLYKKLTDVTGKLRWNSRFIWCTKWRAVCCGGRSLPLYFRCCWLPSSKTLASAEEQKAGNEKPQQMIKEQLQKEPPDVDLFICFALFIWLAVAAWPFSCLLSPQENNSSNDTGNNIKQLGRIFAAFCWLLYFQNY